ncbi:Abnormal pharyngeal pumping family member [Aphelenchoides besseyi]|nr:Abnormal pharyngeal pumping family member [Aphelenchoides besseyi]
MQRPTRLLISPNKRVVRITNQRQFVSAILRHALKLRYWISAGIIGGGITAGNWYEEWKKSLPDISLPEWANFEDGPLKQFAEEYERIKLKWSERDRIDLSEIRKRFESMGGNWQKFLSSDKGLLDGHQYLYHSVSAGPHTKSTEQTADSPVDRLFTIFGGTSKSDSEKSETVEKVSDAERIQKLQDEIIKTQMQYQREVERLEKENKILKQRLLLSDKGEQKRMKKLKRSLIDMYSEMLDILSDYDASYIAADNLPRVVVVGDQSAGKTSVLEMVAQARIFPRGSGEMMTRAPVKVTLSEGPYHIAQFRNSSREFDLTKESDLEQLRNEIELRMRNSVADGKTVSNEVISLTVKGPNLPRIVLVDLPGIISTVTADMARETKDDIIRMCRQHMENPNSIILCIQDGSVDAERSNVTELVSRMNPSGDRTILVLTKVDLAEKNMNDPGRIQKILEGKLFPMKAIGYFGVVTGKDSKSNSIEEIRRYEKEFFENSKLFKEGILKPSQMTTRNMSIAVSDCFWRMVRDTIEAQADSFRAARFNLETEWKNTFPRIRELDRDELFDKARSEILDEVVNLSLLHADEWDQILSEKLLATASEHVFDQILLPTSSVTNAGAFKTAVDIRLKHWAEKELANLTVEVGWDSFKDVFGQQIEGGLTTKSDSTDSELFKPLKKAVVKAILEQHRWDQKASEYLKVIQLNAIGDQNISDRKTWEAACDFMRNAVQRHLEKTREALHAARGPGFIGKWFKWQSPTYDNLVSEHLQDELRKILNENENHPATLSDEDITIVRRGLETKQLTDVAATTIQREWTEIFREFYLERLLQASNDCLSFYQNYKQGFNGETEVDCQAVVLFHRLKKMLDLSTNALRQQITNTEQRRLEKEVKDLLDDWSQDQEIKKTYLTGRRVELAEELKRVRYIQEKLEEFMIQLHQQKP